MKIKTTTKIPLFSSVFRPFYVIEKLSLIKKTAQVFVIYEYAVH